MIERLKAIRGNLTYEQFAMVLNKSGLKFDKSKLSKYERGHMKPATDFYTAIATLGYNVNWFLTGNGEMLMPDCKSEKLMEENQRLKKENDVVRKMVGYEAVKYIETQFSLNDKPSKNQKYNAKRK